MVSTLSLQDESIRLLGMIHQGRPLSALPLEELAVPPVIPTLNIAPLLNLSLVKYWHLPYLGVAVNFEGYQVFSFISNLILGLN